MKKLRFIILALLLIISMTLVIPIYNPRNLIYVNTTIYSNGGDLISQFNYDYTKDSDVISFGQNGFKIQNDNLKNPNIVSDIVSNIFNTVGFGWHDVCYQNIKTIVYFCRKPTPITSPIIFTIYESQSNGIIGERDIVIPSNNVRCELYNTKKGVNVVINNKVTISPESIKELNNYIESNNLADCSDKITATPNITAKVYVRPNVLLTIIKNLLLVIAIYGLFFLIVEIWKFLNYKK